MAQPTKSTKWKFKFVMLGGLAQLRKTVLTRDTCRAVTILIPRLGNSIPLQKRFGWGWLWVSKDNCSLHILQIIYYRVPPSLLPPASHLPFFPLQLLKHEVSSCEILYSLNISSCRQELTGSESLPSYAVRVGQWNYSQLQHPHQ